MSNDVPNEGPCIGDCGATIDKELFCYGCKAFICDDCAMNEIAGFTHLPSDHLDGSECCDAKISGDECVDCGGPGR